MTTMTEHLAEQARRNGWVAATQAEAAELVAAGILERASGAGRGMGNTPVWEPTAEARERWALEGIEERRQVRAMGEICEVLSEVEGGRLLILRRGERVIIPEKLARPL